jgi:hypothetical protein
MTRHIGAFWFADRLHSERFGSKEFLQPFPFGMVKPIRNSVETLGQNSDCFIEIHFLPFQRNRNRQGEQLPHVSAIC